jgi:hypothetical protein
MCLGRLDIGNLRTLVSAAKENHVVSVLSEVNTIAWTKINPQFVHAFTDRIAVAEISIGDAEQSSPNDALAFPSRRSDSSIVRHTSSDVRKARQPVIYRSQLDRSISLPRTWPLRLPAARTVRSLSPTISAATPGIDTL